MLFSNSNASIGCTVSKCAHHNSEKNQCKLDNIKVACCGPSNKSCACTECDSYQMKESGC